MSVRRLAEMHSNSARKKPSAYKIARYGRNTNSLRTRSDYENRSRLFAFIAYCIPLNILNIPSACEPTDSVVITSIWKYCTGVILFKRVCVHAPVCPLSGFNSTAIEDRITEVARAMLDILFIPSALESLRRKLHMLGNESAELSFMIVTKLLVTKNTITTETLCSFNHTLSKALTEMKENLFKQM
ncbi:hypothetical protein Tcan_18925 [Toxocara canis]|uniref:Uncharacterized protein n=1 Tax=Toxocara canis TaxID=6265 RepID=A0A0B2UP02_TOXCA|nr:hypothetical protein Tcan_18925 [Toxocara canis]